MLDEQWDLLIWLLLHMYRIQLCEISCRTLDVISEGKMVWDVINECIILSFCIRVNISLSILLYKYLQIHVNLCQRLLFLQNIGRTCCVHKLFWMSKSISVHNMLSPCSELGIFMYWTCNSMKNMSSYCGLVDAKIRASDKDLPVQLTLVANFLALWHCWVMTWTALDLHSIFWFQILHDNPKVDMLCDMFCSMQHFYRDEL